MYAHFRFPLSSLNYQIRDNQQNWFGSCNAEFGDASPNDYPLREDVTFLNSIPAEIGVMPLIDGELDSIFYAKGLDDIVTKSRQEGYPCNKDALLIKRWPKGEESAG